MAKVVTKTNQNQPPAQSQALATTQQSLMTTPQGNQMQELATNRQMSAEVAEIQSMMIFAMHNPRNWDLVQLRIDHAAKNPVFADAAIYSFPRGKKKEIAENGTERWVDNIVEGPSVVMARELAKLVGNIRYGYTIVREDRNTRVLEGWALDLETNTKVTGQDVVEKVIERKTVRKDKNNKILDDIVGQTVNTTTGETLYLIRPGERDLRELQNRRAAFLVRNMILQLIPDYVVKDVILKCNVALEIDSKGVEAKTKIVAAFQAYNIDQVRLEGYIGKKISECTPTDIATLRKLMRGIIDGNTDPKDIGTATASDPAKDKPDEPPLAGKAKPSSAPNRGHDNEGLDKVAEQAKKNEDATKTDDKPKRGARKKPEKAPSVPQEPQTTPEATDGQGELLPEIIRTERMVVNKALLPDHLKSATHEEITEWAQNQKAHPAIYFIAGTLSKPEPPVEESEPEPGWGG